MNEKNKMEIIIVRFFLTQKNYGKCGTMGMNCLLSVIDFNIPSKGFSKWIKIILLTKIFFHSLFKKGVSGNVLNTRPQNVTTKLKLK